MAPYFGKFLIPLPQVPVIIFIGLLKVCKFGEMQILFMKYTPRYTWIFLWQSG
jgi:hypothetical protein